MTGGRAVGNIHRSDRGEGIDIRCSIDGFERAEFVKTLVLGGEHLRRRMMMELTIRDFERGETPVIIDFRGRYSPLLDYIPSIKIYKIGKHLTFSPLKELFRGYSRVIASIFGALYGLSRDERIYLSKALEAVYREGKSEPNIDDIFERLLQMEAEAQPKEGYKIEGLKHTLSEVEIGLFGSVLKGKERQMGVPMILDLGSLMPKERFLMLVCSLMRVKDWRATCLVVDGLDWSVLAELEEIKMVIGERIEGVCEDGAVVRIGTDSVFHAPVVGTAYIFCGPIWFDEVRWIEGVVGRGSIAKQFRHLEDGAGLVLTWRRAPFYLKQRISNFREVGDGEVEEHMAALGEAVEVSVSEEGREARMLEKIFKDKASLFYAKEFLRLVGEGRVAVEAVSEQKNALLRNTIRVLKRYFMVVEHMDGSGTKWYRLTKVGEKALREMEGEGE